MSQPIKCSLCEEAATVHLSQVVHGKVTKVHLCEACAQKGGATDPAVFQLADALTTASPAPTLTCPQCGFTDIDFRKRGRLGCPSCWETFGDALGGLLRADDGDGIELRGAAARERQAAADTTLARLAAEADALANLSFPGNPLRVFLAFG